LLYARKRRLRAEAKAKAKAKASPVVDLENLVFNPVTLKKEHSRKELNAIAEGLKCEGYEDAETKQAVVDLIMEKAPKDPDD